jgi:hypothetical protein
MEVCVFYLNNHFKFDWTHNSFQGPLINIKKAIFRLKEEVAEMDVKIGVMEHSLNADLIRQRGNYTELESYNV